MHWHYRLNHPTHTVMTRMAKLRMLPKEITRILKTMDKQKEGLQCAMIVVEREPQENPGEVKVKGMFKNT